MTKSKKILMATSLCAFAMATAFGVQAPKTVSAQTSDLDNAKAWLEQSFVMEKGAGVRLANDGDGIRFAAQWAIPDAQETALETAGAKYGMIIAPLDSIPQNGTIDKDSVFGAESPYYFAGQTAVQGKTLIYNVENAVIQNVDDDADMEMTGALIDLKTQNFVREYVGVAYVAVPATYEADETTVATWDYYFAKYYDNNVANNTRSMYYVAQGLIEQNDVNATKLQTKYIDGYASIASGYWFNYTVNHHYNDTTETEVRKGDLNATVNVADVLKENVSYGYDADEQASENAATSGRVYAGGRLTLDVYYSQKIDAADMTLADVGLAKASTFTGVEVENAPDGIANVSYTYNDGADVPTTAGLYTAKATFEVEEGYLPIEPLTASVRLIGDNATIGAHGANGFEVNYTLSNGTATASDFKSGGESGNTNMIFLGMPSYEDALNKTNGSTIRLASNVNLVNLPDYAWNYDVIDYYSSVNRSAGAAANWYDGLANLTERWYNDKAWEKVLCYKETVDDVTTYYMDLKLRVVNTATGSTITLYVDHGNNSGTPIWGITTSKKFDAGYAGLNYDACLEGRSYLSNFSVTDLSANYREATPTYAKITSTDFEMYYTLSDTTGSYATTNGYNTISYNLATTFANKTTNGNKFYGEYISLGRQMKAEANSVNPIWTDYTGLANNKTNVSTKKFDTGYYCHIDSAVTTFVNVRGTTMGAKYVYDFDNDGKKEVKFKWTFKNVTVDETTTATIELWLMNKNGSYDKIVTVTNMDAISSDEKMVGLYYQNYGLNAKSFVSDFKVVCNDAQ